MNNNPNYGSPIGLCDSPIILAQKIEALYCELAVYALEVNLLNMITVCDNLIIVQTVST